MATTIRGLPAEAYGACGTTFYRALLDTVRAHHPHVRWILGRSSGLGGASAVYGYCGSRLVACVAEVVAAGEAVPHAR